MIEEIKPTDTPTKSYPFATSDEFYFESEEDETLGIETAHYDNGSSVKKAKLSDGRIAKCRRLKGRDQRLIQRLIANDKDKYQLALMSVAITIDDKPVVMEDFENLWMNDYTVCMGLSLINF